MPRKPRPLADRFWEKVERGPGCWLWKASLGTHGYGQIKVGGRPQSASRVAWVLTFGDVPSGLEVCHRCDNPPCVRPEHLFLGTHGTNMADRTTKGRAARRLTIRKAIAIHELARSGKDARTIAALIGVSSSAVNRVLVGRSWSQLYEPPEGITIREAAARLGVGEAGLKSQAHKGKLATHRHGSRIYTTEAEVERYRQENRRAA